jgi:hypothetical protein
MQPDGEVRPRVLALSNVKGWPVTLEATVDVSDRHFNGSSDAYTNLRVWQA